jgi:hypothetical protein
MAIRYSDNTCWTSIETGATVTDIRRAVTDIRPIVTENTPTVTINQKRGRGRPATGVALSAADRARKYRDSRRGAVAAS